MTWYEQLREGYRPERVELLLIGESAPDARGGERRFFYAPTLAAADNLFRGVVEALYDHRFPRGSAGISKVSRLDRLHDDGVFLIDLVPFPVNSLRSGERTKAHRDHAAAAAVKAAKLKPAGIVVCHAPSFRALAPLLRERRLPLLHEDAIPCPLGNKRAEFVTRFRAAVHRLRSPKPGASSAAHA